jgi:hypothetical protein
VKGILFISLFSLMLFASNLEVQSKKFSFHLKFDEKQINFESFQTKIKVNKSKCNAEAFEVFYEKFKQKIKKKVLIADASEAINLKLDDKSYKINPNSALANYLNNLNLSVMALKVQEEKGCE